MTYKKYKWQVVASDFNSAFIRDYLCTKCAFMAPRILGISRFLIGIVSENNQIKYIADMPTWKKVHEELKKKALKDYNFVEFLIDKSHELGEEFNKWTEEKIFNTDLKSLSGNELISLLREFIEKQGELYVYGLTLPILDFGNFSFVEGNLKKFLREKVSDKEFMRYYTVFTEPAHNSFAQDQEEDLLILMKEFYTKNWVSDVKKKSLDELKDLYPKFYEKLKEHTRKHCWVYYVYMGPAFTEQNFLEFIRDYLNKNIEPEKKLKEINDKKNEVKRLKQEYIKELKPDKFYLAIVKLVGKFVWAKPRRKDYQSKSYYHFEKLMLEIARRLHLSLEQARSMPVELLEKGLKGGDVDYNIANTILKFHVCVPNDDGTISVLTGNEAKNFYEKNVEKEEEKELGDVSELKGNTACHGNAKGIVKIVNLPSDMKKMEYGNILVSTATTPSIVPAMKKAAAIITDEGGLTCHAAIVSRELNIPCIIGTQIATKVLKDGDEVEMDADNGIVKILKKK